MNEPSEQQIMPVDRRTLDGVAVLEALTATERAELEAACIWRRYRHGERLFERGNASNEVLGAGSMISRSPSLRMIASSPGNSNSRGIRTA